MDKKNVLVTGGAGFIGSFLCEALLKAGKRVIAVDNFLTGHIRNIESLLRNPDFQFLRLDIAEPFALDDHAELADFKVKFLGVEEIYHLAMPTIIKGFEEYRMATLLTNALGTKHVLDCAKQYSAKVVFSSAAVVYGAKADDETRIKEEYDGAFNHLSPRGCYNEGKRFAETMCQTYADVYGLDIRIARIFRTYGPRMPLFHGHQIPDFVLNALAGDALVVSGDEKSSTSLAYVTDIVDGLTRLMRAERGIGPVNLGSDVAVTMVDVANRIIGIAESSSKVDFEPAPPYLIPLGLPDSTKAKEKLGWTPLVRLDDGLAKTVDYVRANKLLLTEGKGEG